MPFILHMRHAFRIGILVLAAGLILALPLTARAADVSGTIDESTVSIIGSWIMRLIFRNTNNTTINNTVNATSNSGRNEVSSADDQSGTTIQTGGTYTAAMVENEANNNFISVEAESPDGTDATVADTSDESDVGIETTDTIDSDVENTNEAVTTNDINTESNSGENRVRSDDDLDTVLVDTGASQTGSGLSNLFNIDIFHLVRRIRPR